MFYDLYNVFVTGSSRVNDLYQYHFPTKLWNEVRARGVLPSPRDRHIAVVWRKSLFVFGGFDGSSIIQYFSVAVCIYF